MPALTALSGDTSRFLERISEQQWGIMLSVYCISHVPALITLDIPGYDGQKLLLIEIASHVGRRETETGSLWGELDRFGTPSPCCGALQLLLDIPASAGAVRFPWFDQLTAFDPDGAIPFVILRNPLRMRGPCRR